MKHSASGLSHGNMPHAHEHSNLRQVSRASSFNDFNPNHTASYMDLPHVLSSEAMVSKSFPPRPPRIFHVRVTFNRCPPIFPASLALCPWPGLLLKRGRNIICCTVCLRKWQAFEPSKQRYTAKTHFFPADMPMSTLLKPDDARRVTGKSCRAASGVSVSLHMWEQLQSFPALHCELRARAQALEH